MSDDILPSEAPTARVRAWCFTAYDPFREVEAKLEAAIADNHYIDWFIVNPEVCPTTGRPHAQGYLYAANKRRFSELQARFSGWHFKRRVASHEKARDYCRKGESCDSYHGPECAECRYSAYRTMGVEPQGESGGRPSKPRAALAARIIAGDSLKAVALSDPGTALSCLRSLRDLQHLVSKPRDPKGPATELRILYGAAGSGKSRFVFDNHKLDDIYVHPSGPWWDGYDGHAVVLLDDFYGDIPYNLLYHLADRYPLSLPVKGGFTQFRARIIYITTNKRPYELYNIAHDWRPAFFRRVTYLMALETDGTWFSSLDITAYSQGQATWVPLPAPPTVGPAPDYSLAFDDSCDDHFTEDLATVPGFTPGESSARVSARGGAPV